MTTIPWPEVGAGIIAANALFVEKTAEVIVRPPIKVRLSIDGVAFFTLTLSFDFITRLPGFGNTSQNLVGIGLGQNASVREEASIASKQGASFGLTGDTNKRPRKGAFSPQKTKVKRRSISGGC